MKLAASALPAALAVLLPKCPLCVAAWAGASAGIAVPTIVAGNLRMFLMMTSILAAALLVRGIFQSRRSCRSPHC